MLDDIRGVGNGRDRVEELINEMILSGEVVLVVDDSWVGRLKDEVVKLVLGELLGSDLGKDVKEGLVVNEGGR